MTSTSDFIATIWSDLESWYAQHAPRLSSSLRPGAAAESLEQLAAAVGASVPPDLRASLARHDGKPRIGYYELLPVKEILYRYRGELEDGLGRPSQVRGDDQRRVRLDEWCEGWIPFAEDSGLNFFCVDMNPDVNGVVGQVIVWERGDKAASPTEFRSFAEWLARYRDDVLAGKYFVDENGFVFPK